MDEPIGERFAALAALRERGLIRQLADGGSRRWRRYRTSTTSRRVATRRWWRTAPRSASPARWPVHRPVGGRQLDSHDALDRVAARHGGTAAQAALAWLLDRSPALLPILGTASVEHLAENVAAGGIALTEADRADLAAESG